MNTELIKAILASAVSGAILVCGTVPAAAHDREHEPSHKATAAPRTVERAYSAPRPVERTYTEPRPVERTYTEPRPVERTYSAPRPVERVYSAPRPVERTYSVPRAEVRTIAPRRDDSMRQPPARVIMPVRRQHFAETAPRERFVQTAPRKRFVQTAPRERFVQTAPRERFVQTAPRERFVQTAPRRHIVRSAPFIQRVRFVPRQTARENRAPFIQYVHLARRPVRSFTTVREVATSPLIRTVERRNHLQVVYHPAYLTGRVVAVRRQVVVLQPPTGSQILVNAAALPDPVAFLPVNSYVTVPVTYTNGAYDVFVPPGYAYNPYGYGYNGYNGYPYNNGYAYDSGDGYNNYAYPYGTAAYCGNSGSSLLYSALLPTVLSAVSGGGVNLNASDLATLALTAVTAGANACYQGYNAYNPGYAPVYNAGPVYNAAPVYNPYPVYGANGYGTPYDNSFSGFGYGPNPSFGAYGLQQVQGLVVAKTGSMLMVLGGNGMSPVFVNAAPAFQNGYSVNGPVAVGQVINAYGFYNGDTFVATAIV